ncbi:MAG: hypothetical protein R6X34_26275, partial [Chloroflexota bacterium]
MSQEEFVTTAVSTGSRQAVSTSTNVCIIVIPRLENGQTNGRSYVQAACQLGYTQLQDCHVARLYFLQGSLTVQDAIRLADELLVDPVTEEWIMVNGNRSTVIDGTSRLINNHLPITVNHFIEATLDPGVTDPPAENLVKAARLLGVSGLERAATGHRFFLSGQIDAATLPQIAAEIFANPVVQRFTLNKAIEPPFFPFQGIDDTVESISLREAESETLLAISKERRLALDLAEMQAVQAYFRLEEREPTDVELEMIAQTWSEHCVHKTFRAKIDYTGPDGKTETIDG